MLSLVGSANVAGAGGALYAFGQRLGARPVEITPGAPVQRPEMPYSQAFGEQRTETLRALTEAEAQNPEVALATAVGTTLATGFIPGAQGRGLATIGGKLAGRLGPTAARVGEVALPAAVRTAGMALGRVSGEDAGEDAMSVAKAAGAYGRRRRSPSPRRPFPAFLGECWAPPFQQQLGRACSPRSRGARPSRRGRMR